MIAPAHFHVMSPDKHDPDSAQRAQTLLGFDYGAKRTGVAVAQTMTRQASPLSTLASKQHKPDWDSISKMITEWQPDALVVGHPLHMDGSEQEMTKAAEKFARQLEGRYHLPVHLVDERLSSDAAETELMHRGQRYQDGDIDMQAACIILQDWLDQHTE